MWIRWLAIALVAVLIGGCSSAETSASSTMTEPLTTTTVVSTLAPTTTTSSSTTTTEAPTTTTTVAPPMLEVTDPDDGAVVATQVYTFRGVTDPGCTVSVGDRYYADVAADGTWSLDLKLRPGANTTSFVASNPAGDTTTTRLSMTYLPITLRSDGLGVVSFGDTEDDVMATLEQLLGGDYTEWLYESTPEFILEITEVPGDNVAACWSGFGTTCFEYLRVIRWEDVGLRVTISDWVPASPNQPSESGPIIQAPPNLRGYAYTGAVSGPGFTTDEGITVGSTVDDLTVAYGNQLDFIYDECTFTVAGFAVGTDPHYFAALRGELSTLPETGDATVESIEAGQLWSGC